jgi:hypothetical protein
LPQAVLEECLQQGAYIPLQHVVSLHPEARRVLCPQSLLDEDIDTIDVDTTCLSSWSTIGVVVKKPVVKMSRHGTQYCVLRLANLHQAECSLVLLGQACKKYWNIAPGSVVALHNAQLLKNNQVSSVVWCYLLQLIHHGSIPLRH